MVCAQARRALALLAVAGVLLLAAGVSAQPARTLPAQPPAAAPVPAPAPPPPKPAPAADNLVVGIIDIGAVLNESTAAQALQRQLQIEQDKYQVAFDQEQRDLRTAEEDIERERASSSPETYAERRRLFQERLNKAANEFRLRRRQLEEAFTRANAQVNDTLSNVIGELAASRGIGVVLRHEAVLFQKNAVDLTQPAIALLNSKLPTVSATLPATP